jgi:hypothetical protein
MTSVWQTIDMHGYDLRVLAHPQPVLPAGLTR